MRGVPRWFAVLCVVAVAVVVCAFSLRRVFAPASLRMLPTRIDATGFSSQNAELTTAPDATDSFGDGTPDFLRLADSADRRAFRGWFTLLAESQYFRQTKLPSEIQDCASLLRYSYREALRRHDSAWANSAALIITAARAKFVSIATIYSLGASLFRVRDGGFTRRTCTTAPSLSSPMPRPSGEPTPTVWDATSIRSSRRPALLSPVGRPQHLSRHDLRRPSQIELGPEQYFVYHTGPQGHDAGEIRRLTVSELMNFSDARWRPVSSNPSFLGVYRWNILRGDQ